MEKKTTQFLNKIKIDTYIYAFIFMAVAVFYAKTQAVGSDVFMLLIAAFAFYALGRQVRLVTLLEEGAEIDTKPRAMAWIRGVTYFVVLLMLFSLMFA